MSLIEDVSYLTIDLSRGIDYALYVIERGVLVFTLNDSGKSTKKLRIVMIVLILREEGVQREAFFRVEILENCRQDIVCIQVGNLEHSRMN